MMQVRGMRRTGAEVQERSIVCFCAVERNKQCQELIAKASRGPLHVFDDVLRRLPPDYAERLKDMRPKTNPEQDKGSAGSEDATQQRKRARRDDAAACYRQQAAYVPRQEPQLAL